MPVRTRVWWEWISRGHYFWVLLFWTVMLCLGWSDSCLPVVGWPPAPTACSVFISHCHELSPPSSPATASSHQESRQVGDDGSLFQTSVFLKKCVGRNITASCCASPSFTAKATSSSCHSFVTKHRPREVMVAVPKVSTWEPGFTCTQGLPVLFAEGRGATVTGAHCFTCFSLLA